MQWIPKKIKEGRCYNYSVRSTLEGAQFGDFLILP